MALSLHPYAEPWRSVPLSGHLSDGIRDHHQYDSLCLRALFRKSMVSESGLRMALSNRSGLTRGSNRLDLAWAMWWMDSVVALVIAIGVPFVM